MAETVAQLPAGFVLDERPIVTPPATPVAPPTAQPQLPEGFALDAPAPVVPEETAIEEARPGFMERVSADIAERQALGDEIRALHQRGEQGFAESLLQLTGKVAAGSILDFLGNVAISGVEGLSAITPDVIEDPLVESATKAAHLFLETDLGKAGLSAAQEGIDAWNEFKIENPRAARNIESVVNIGLLMTPAKGRAAVPTQPTLAGRAATVLDTKATAQAARRKAEFVDELVIPKPTPTTRAERVARTTEEGILGTRQVGLSPSERAMADAVGAIEDVGSHKTLQGNYTTIAKEVSDEARNLETLIKKNDVAIPRREFAAELGRATARLEDNPLLVGDAARTSAKVVEKMKQIVEKNPGTASGLLKSRKELDAWIKAQKPKVFDAGQENALTTAVREIRQSTNDFIDSRAVNVDVKDSLRKQSNLLKAMDNIAPKAAVEADNAILRAWQNANKVLGLRGEFNQTMASLFGLGGLGASAVFAPMFTKLALGGVATYAAGRAVLSPTAKRGVAKLLKTTDNAIRTAKDEALISQMRLDRAALVELLRQSTETEPENNG